MQNGTKSIARRGRPPAYDRDAALRSLTEAFWDQGYAGTSLDSLADATGMNRPSLYAAFGDKAAMYQAALAAYRTTAETQIRAALAVSDVRQAVAGFLAAAVDFYRAGPNGPRGCLAVCTAASEAVRDDDIRAAMDGVLAMIDTLLTERLAAAVTAGQLPADFDIDGRSLAIAALLHSLAVRARAGTPPDRLHLLAAMGLHLLD